MDLPYSVYILECRDNTHYVGFTRNIKTRIEAHTNGEVKYTKKRLPVKLVYMSHFKHSQTAYDFERYLKTGSGIAFRNKRLL